MVKFNRNQVLAVAGALGLASVASATPLVNISIVGSTDGGNTYSSNLIVTPGQSVTFKVLGQLAPVSTVNTHGTTTSIVGGTDGINSLAFNLLDSANGSYNGSSLALGTGWSGGSGFSVGAVSGNTLTDVRPIEAPGVFAGATGPSVLLTGTFNAGSFTSSNSETLGGAWASTGTTSGSFKINGGSAKVVTTTTETSTDPDVGFSGLALSIAPTPEPGSLALLGAGSLGLLMRRRRA